MNTASQYAQNYQTPAINRISNMLERGFKDVYSKKLEAFSKTSTKTKVCTKYVAFDLSHTLSKAVFDKLSVNYHSINNTIAVCTGNDNAEYDALVYAVEWMREVGVICEVLVVE